MKHHLLSSGPRSGDHGTIVFLHGFPFRAAMWEDQLEGTPDGWRALAPDLRGFGQTDIAALPGEVPTGRKIGCRIARRSEPVLTMSRLADDVAELIREEAGDGVVVCGLSMGGYVALELWRRHPDRIRGLILADTRAHADDDEGRENRLRTAQTVRRDGAAPVADAMIPALLADGTRTRSPELVRWVREMILETAPGTLIAALAGMATRHDTSGELGEIAVPTLVMAGEHDTLTPPAVGRAMADSIPDAEFREIPAAGHLANMENPEAFNAGMSAFLGRIRALG